MPIGERMNTSGYVQHPPASSGWLPDGAPLDAGTAHILHHNLSHLSEQNTRLVAHLRGPGAIGYDNGPGAWDDVVDADVGADALGSIPWHQAESAVVTGPLALSMTRLGTAPAGFTPRKFRVVVECEKGNTAGTVLRILAALVGGPDTPLRAPRYAVTYAAIDRDVDGAGQYVIDLSLDASAPLRPTTAWRCRDSGASADSSAFVTPAWLWVGWYSDDGFNLDRVWSISVFEVY